MDEFLAVLENLIAYFVQRQRIVVLAMLDINPRDLGGRDGRILDINVAPYWKIHQEKRSLIWQSEDKEAKHNLYQGVWKSNWKFLQHGIGCKLTNLQTGEPIEWDAPDPHAISLHWFLTHLEWRLKNEADDPFVKQCRRWLDDERSDLDDIRKVLYLMIDKQILFLKQNHTCCLTTQRYAEQKSIPDIVSQAVQNLLNFYKERQQLVIAAMVELRPDIIKFRSEERLLDSGAVTRLRALIINSENEFKGWSFTKGIWGNDSWDYDLRHTRLTIINKSTSEPLTWAASDPYAVEIDGFRIHLQWRINNQSDDENIKTCADWHKKWTQAYRPERTNAEDEAWLLNPWALLNDLTEQRIIDLKQDDYGIMIK